MEVTRYWVGGGMISFGPAGPAGPAQERRVGRRTPSVCLEARGPVSQSGECSRRESHGRRTDE